MSAPAVVADADLVWHAAELPGGVGCARQRNLVVDERSGRALVTVAFTTQWWRPAGFGHREMHWTVLEGRVEVGDDELGVGDHLVMPGGARVPRMTVDAGTRVAIWRHSSWYFDQSDWHQPWADGEVRVVRAAEVAPTEAGAVLVQTPHVTITAFAPTSSAPQAWPTGTTLALLVDGCARGELPILSCVAVREPGPEGVGPGWACGDGPLGWLAYAESELTEPARG